MPIYTQLREFLDSLFHIYSYTRTHSRMVTRVIAIDTTVNYVSLIEKVLRKISARVYNSIQKGYKTGVEGKCEEKKIAGIEVIYVAVAYIQRRVIYEEDFSHVKVACLAYT